MGPLGRAQWHSWLAGDLEAHGKVADSSTSSTELLNCFDHRFEPPLAASLLFLLLPRERAICFAPPSHLGRLVARWGAPRSAGARREMRAVLLLGPYREHRGGRSPLRAARRSHQGDGSGYPTRVSPALTEGLEQAPLTSLPRA